MNDWNKLNHDYVNASSVIMIYEGGLNIYYLKKYFNVESIIY